MTTIQQILKNTAVNGVISVTAALKAVAGIDQEREATVQLLKDCEKEVGLYNGEKINSHLATMTGGHFNPIEYSYERLPGEQ
ncbi:hypothetical protein SNE25_21065 [Mucilaginibacter sabulilitoris]|uniref:Uncharacterized protein n=1 Tax=Mucilaginibacter sabulilitoris TaxID=1173583 RepID=A0ABZ0TFT2_9SPHI|nr:hypothetical protein [Mucilaginibacter sabulilitoris]WPU91812.1 hypothetical protein SNE25_21065 [Mucilaginibacter sabulilitoris]